MQSVLSLKYRVLQQQLTVIKMKEYFKATWKTFY